MPALTMQLDGLAIPQVTVPHYGIDPSTERIAVGIVLPGQRVAWATHSLGGRELPERLARAHAELTVFFRGLRQEHGAGPCDIEEPFGHGRLRVHPNSQRFLGVTIAAAFAELSSRVGLANSSTWKCDALGDGHGHAEKAEVLLWARDDLGYTGTLQDEADALGIAVALARRPPS